MTLIAPHPTERRPFPWKRVAIDSGQAIAWGLALGGIVRGDWAVVAAGLALACYVELRKWGRV